MQIASLKQLCALLNIPCQKDGPVRGFSIDSRTIAPGEVFCALQGERVDGHQFIQDALARGASAVIASNAASGLERHLIVPDVLTALQSLAAGSFKAARVPCIAVTGSVGKTTLKEFICQLLEGHFRIFKTPGNANSQVGLPLAILNGLNDRNEVAVLEMGMSRAGEIARLVKIAPPQVAVINSVGYCHAENFEGLAGIAKAKSEIFSHADTKHKIYHWSIEGLMGGAPAEGSKPFGLQNEALAFTLLPASKGYIYKEGETRKLIPEPPFNEAYLLHNLLAALAAVRSFGVSLEDVESKIPLLQTPEKRFQRIQKKGVILINDAYNACPLSMKAALKAIPATKQGGRRFAVLGSMAELGRFSEGCHREVGSYALPFADALYCLGPDCAPMVEEWKKAGREPSFFTEYEALLNALKKEVREGDVVLVKGSNSHQLWKLVDEF